MIILAPDQAPIVVRDQVGLRDLLPTILDMVGLPSPPAHGRSMTPLLRGESQPPRPMYSEVNMDGHKQSIIWEQHHLIVSPFLGKTELYDWRTDPTERVNLADKHPRRVAELRAMIPQLDLPTRSPDYAVDQLPHRKKWTLPPEFRRGAANTTPVTSSPEDDSIDISRLESLGYVGPS
jgi:arylsulfatase A-like enzyme